MRPIQTQTPNHQKTRLPRRAFMLGGLQAATALIIGARMYHLGVMKNDQYRLLAEENRISIRLLSPSRGLIYDR
ncbi:MAG: penicillin-binding protein 2, partial [Proteobacteria bacterium]|nr:penicillin-binding protein 2 [Pseudomonadota bacterium]